MTAKRRKPVVSRSAFALGSPIFCSTKCAHVFKPANLTINKLLGINAQLQLAKGWDDKLPYNSKILSQ